MIKLIIIHKASNTNELSLNKEQIIKNLQKNSITDESVDFIIYGLCMAIIFIVNCIMPIQCNSLKLFIFIGLVNLLIVYCLQAIVNYIVYHRMIWYFFIMYLILCNIVYIIMFLYWNSRKAFIYCAICIVSVYCVLYILWFYYKDRSFNDDNKKNNDSRNQQQ